MSKKEEIDKRVIDVAKYFISTKSTVRATAKHFDVSKSTVHKDLTERLRKISPALYAEVYEILQKNKAERAIRGGIATKKKYLAMKDRMVS